jgi:hypothetical protein
MPTGYHRQIYAKYHGVKLTSKDVIRHTCDNRWCIEITHLIIGTQADNLADARERGRLNSKGSNNGRAKLTEEQVKEIRKKYKSGRGTQAEIAKEFNVSRAQIGKIINYESWRVR